MERGGASPITLRAVWMKASSMYCSRPPIHSAPSLLILCHLAWVWKIKQLVQHHITIISWGMLFETNFKLNVKGWTLDLYPSLLALPNELTRFPEKIRCRRRLCQAVCLFNATSDYNIHPPCLSQSRNIHNNAWFELELEAIASDVNVSVQTSFFTHKTKMLILMCWKCFSAINVLNMMRKDGWILNTSKEEM